MSDLYPMLIMRDAATRVSHSALPDSPVIPEPPPSRARLLAASALHRLATRLDRGQPPLRQITDRLSGPVM